MPREGDVIPVAGAGVRWPLYGDPTFGLRPTVTAVGFGRPPRPSGRRTPAVHREPRARLRAGPGVFGVVRPSPPGCSGRTGPGCPPRAHHGRAVAAAPLGGGASRSSSQLTSGPVRRQRVGGTGRRSSLFGRPV